MMSALAHASFPLPLAGEGAEQSEAGGGCLRESDRRESPHPNPPPQAGEGAHCRYVVEIGNEKE